MKKLLTLLLAAGMIVSAANGASAVEMKVSGVWLTSFHFTDNLYGDNGLLDTKKHEGSPVGNFKANQRVRIDLDMVASEYLSGRVQLQAGSPHVWGEKGTGGAGMDVTARLAYLD